MKKAAKDHLIFALDVPDISEAVRLVKMLDGAVGLFKVGLELFVSEGPQALKAVAEHSSAEIFLDLKLHDIPATVRGALISAAKHRARFVTIHCDEGRKLVESAAVVRDSGLEILAVTVLTSLAEADLPRLGFKDLSLKQLVLDRATLAKESGCAGIVCSGKEIATIRKHCGPDLKIVVPGIRPAWQDVRQDDQSRIVTPADAIRDGADYIVVGRPIRDAQNPRDAAQRINEEIQSALERK
jgi:orotidine-5'-phosphate decarboxylase